MLTLTTGEFTAKGPRERNEDFCGMVTPDPQMMATKGALLAVADGVSGHVGGREAAEMTVRGLLSDYYATPETWEVTVSLDKVLEAINRWVLSQAVRQREMAGMATTLSAIVLRGRRYTIGHVGDSRVYRLRDGQMSRLTTDHVWDRPDMSHVLKRAIGLDEHLQVEYSEGELQAGDVFALMTDGVWERLDDQRVHKIMALYNNPQLAAEDLVLSSIASGGTDNATALVVRVEQLGEENFADLLSAGKMLGLPPKLKAGERLDDFEVLALLHESRASLIYKVRHVVTHQVCVLKTLQPLLAGDTESCIGLMNEEWLAKRVVAHFFPQILQLPMDRRSCLYYLMTFHEGATLQKQLDTGRHFAATDVAGIGIRLIKGLAALHRLNIVHRDIKPANVHMGDDGRIRILDLGVSLSTSLPLMARTQSNPGTPSYMAPELFEGHVANVQSDLYAAGVTLYHLLTRKYPYGEVEPFQHPRFGNPVPPTRYRPEIPQWLESVVLKAIAVDPRQRFETAEEMLLALETGESLPLTVPARLPLAGRSVSGVWKLMAVMSFIVNLLLIYLMIVS
jgi:serine/threonine protein phosphatase PrpC